MHIFGGWTEILFYKLFAPYMFLNQKKKKKRRILSNAQNWYFLNARKLIKL